MAATKLHRSAFRWLHRGPSADPIGEGERAARRRRHMDRVIAVCWALIGLKCLVVGWAVERYQMPFNPLWVIGPTVAFAALATAAYYLLRD